MTITPISTSPDHTQLPCEDGTFVKNFQEHPQSILLTTSIRPVLDRLHPDGQYDIGQDSGIYWKIADPPLNGVEAPDWFYVPNIPPTLNGEMRRSYVLWQEQVSPAIVLEFVSGSDVQERDTTPEKGKFWIYENRIRAAYYGIYEVRRERVEVYRLVGDRYHLIPPNERGHFPIEILGIELGLWQGSYQNRNLPWLRWWDNEGNLLLTGEERAELAERQIERERQQKEQAQQQIERERQRTERLRRLLIENNIDPDEI